jgi:hypothetical protein
VMLDAAVVTTARGSTGASCGSSSRIQGVVTAVTSRTARPAWGRTARGRTWRGRRSSARQATRRRGGVLRADEAEPTRAEAASSGAAPVAMAQLWWSTGAASRRSRQGSARRGGAARW